MDVKLAELSRTVDPVVLGSRIRNARVAAGLTQSDLAADEVTTAYVSRIEGGQRRPEFLLLERMAGRLGVTLESLLVGIENDAQSELRLALDFADLELRSGQAKEAFAGATTVIDEIGDRSLDDLRSEAQLIAALSLESLGQLDEAISTLEALVATGESSPIWMRAAMGLTRCYREAGELSRSIESGESAIKRMNELGLAGTDEAIQLVVTTSAAYFEQGDVRRAVRMCRQASDEAESVNTPKARASAYWNASIFESRQGNVPAAVSLARQALALMEQANEHTSIALLNNQLGTILLRLDPPAAEEAKAALEVASVQLASSSASVVDIGHNLVALAKAHYLSGDSVRALELAGDALAKAGDVGPLVRVNALVLIGRIQASDRKIARSRKTFLEAVQVLTAMGADRQAAQLWFELGALLEEVGESEAARDAYKRAAASTGLLLPTAAPQRASANS